MAPKVLFVLSSHDQLGTTGNKTGWYLPEFAHPYTVLESVADIVVASPNGGEAPLDPSSVEAFKDDSESQDFLKNKSALWTNTHKLSEFVGKAYEFAAIFYVGGHGPMFDLCADSTSQRIIREFVEADKVVSAVCHGPASLIGVKLADGSSLISGQAVTGFSNVEEDQAGLSSAMPFLLESELDKISGGKFEKAKEPWASHVVVSRNGKLITGQNPASATPLGAAIAQAISV